MVPPTRDIAQRLLDRYVYRTQANYQRTVREASQVLTRVLNLDALLAFLSHTVATSTQAEGVAVYLRDEQGLRRAIVDTRHQGSDFAAPERTPVEVRALLEAFREPLVAEEIARAPAAAGLGAAADQLARANWSLLLPVLSEDTVIGAIVLGPKLSGDPYYPQDLDLLMTLANQAGVAIKNAQLYAQVVLANEYIENIVATIESGVIAINSSGHIAMFNRAAARLTGLSEADVTGRPVGVLPARLAATLVGTVTDGQARTHPEIDLPAVAPADEPLTRPVICTTSPLRDETGAVLGAVAVFSDLTPVKELEIERRRAERLAYFEVLASGIAHEIKNPLVAIKTFAQLLPRRLGDDRFIDDFGRIVTREVTRMERLGERLRALARPGERPRHLLDLRAPLTEALEFLQSSFDEKGITVRASLGDTACSILGDRGELEQLFLNLLMNAHEATPPGGAVLVELTRTEAHVTIAVADTGPGIPPELLERVFEPFFTTKQRGTGLGLAIGAGIAQAHGARLRAANRPAGGALLTVDFPVTATVPTPVTA